MLNKISRKNEYFITHLGIHHPILMHENHYLIIVWKKKENLSKVYVSVLLIQS